MSAAASLHELNVPTADLEDPAIQDKAQLDAEREALEKLVASTTPSQAGPLIAIDFDDVLSQTNQAVADWHNEVYGTDMKLTDFLYYYYWKNPYWGNPKETYLKVREFYRTERIYNTKPVPGAREGVETLRQMGFRLVIVTARPEDSADESWKWVDRYFPGCFENIICTGQFVDPHKVGHEVVTRLNKAQVCDDLKAVLLIDDSAENAHQCTTSERPIPTILFGDYEWNKRLSVDGDSSEDMTFDVRLKNEGGREFWKEDGVLFPEGAPLWRVRNWGETILWIKARTEEGKL